MRHLLLLLVAAIILFSSCGSTNNDKIEEFVQKQVVTSLSHPETYKSISTTIDSSCIDLDIVLDILQKSGDLYVLLEQQRCCLRDMNIAQYRMDSVKEQYYAAKKEFTLQQTELERISPIIEKKLFVLKSLASKAITSHFTNWCIHHQFKAKDEESSEISDFEVILFANDDFTNYSIPIEAMHFNIIIDIIKELPNIEEDDEIYSLVEFLSRS